MLLYVCYIGTQQLYDYTIDKKIKFYTALVNYIGTFIYLLKS
jgi:hypothetical protein